MWYFSSQPKFLTHLCNIHYHVQIHSHWHVIIFNTQKCAGTKIMTYHIKYSHNYYLTCLQYSFSEILHDRQCHQLTNDGTYWTYHMPDKNYHFRSQKIFFGCESEIHPPLTNTNWQVPIHTTKETRTPSSNKKLWQIAWYPAHIRNDYNLRHHKRSALGKWQKTKLPSANS